MKTKLTPVFLLAAFAAFAQSPLVLTQGNFGVISTYNVNSLLGAVNTFPSGTNKTWDYGATPYTGGDLVFYTKATDPFFVSKCDASAAGFIYLNATSGYQADLYLKTSATEYSENGLYIPPQRYSIGTFTGSPSDSITFPEQRQILPQPRVILKFPATYPGNWGSDSRRAVNFLLTVSSVGLNKVPAQHVINIVRRDTVVGWGKMRVYTPSGPSAYYDVLMVNVATYQVDSFYLNGAPAPPLLLGAFGITNGAVSPTTYRTAFYRANTAAPLLLANFGTSRYTTPTLIYVDDNVKTTGTRDLDQGFAAVLYPNPTNGGEVSLQLIGTSWSQATYTITDLSGRTVQSGQLEVQGSTLRVLPGSHLPNGTYVLKAVGDKGGEAVSEQFVLQR